MRIVVTGSPGTGKTSVAKELAKRLGCEVVNEKGFALEKDIGKWGPDSNELVIPLEKLEKELNELLHNTPNIILEGHLLCEIKLDADVCVVLRVDPEMLEERLGRRNYSGEKIQDNVFCEGIDYCKKHALRNYEEKIVLEVENKKSIKETTRHIISKLGVKGAKV